MSEIVAAWFHDWMDSVWPGQDPANMKIEPIEPDGSQRLFLRIEGEGLRLVGMVNPYNQPENQAWRYIAAHLAKLDIAVARVLAADMEQGFFLMEDLGRDLLHDKVLALGDDHKAIEKLYLPVLKMLARLQARGAKDFDLSVCFSGDRLSPDFLFKHEIMYFIENYAVKCCGLYKRALPKRLVDELLALCDRAGEAGPKGLVHRDFQSRNVVWGQTGPALVDFQGARLGPAQYDLASLLHDPYVNLDWDLRLELKKAYLKYRQAEGPFDVQRFEQGWPFVSASRLMQALGAYAFLSGTKGKTKFIPYIAPALNSLRLMARHSAMAEFTAWKALLNELPDRPPKI